MSNLGERRAWLLFQHRKYELAEQEYRSALMTDPDNFRLHAMLAINLMHQLRLPEGVCQVRKAIELEPEQGCNYYTLAVILGRQKEFILATDAIRQAIRLQPQIAIYHAQDAQLRVEQEQYDEGLSKASLALQYGNDEWFLRLTAWSLFKLHRLEEAVAAADAAVALSPESPHAHFLRGLLSKHLCQKKLAKTYFREALRLDPNRQWAKDGPWSW